MKFLLAAINAKYIHSNLGVYSLKQYAGKRLCAQSGGTADGESGPCIQMAEYTINQQLEWILEDIYRRNPDVVGFSCYIWNILYVKEIVRELKKVMPAITIWLGGPEVSYDAPQMLAEFPEVELIMLGEGEETFTRLVELYEKTGHQAGCSQMQAEFGRIPGITYRGADEDILSTGPAPLLSLDEIPFVYGDLKDLQHRIIYYESSRGCPFACSYCLSSIDKRVRFRSLKLVKRELSFFLENRVPQVKFVDRTFNCNRNHALEIWRFLLEHDNGETNFHFEISADLLEAEELALMQQMRPGLIQLEIGVQTANPNTIREIRRSMDLELLKKNVAEVNRFGTVHQHLDLIAGLPFEDFESFRNSFNEVYRMEPEQLQLGFLKVLKGSYMADRAEDYGLLYRSQPPYEVLASRWLSYGQLIRLKGVEEMIEVYYNSGQFRSVIRPLAEEFETPFHLYDKLADYYHEKKLDGLNHNRLARYEILYQFIVALDERKTQLESYRDLLMQDLYLRENLKSRPSFARDQTVWKEVIRSFFLREADEPRYLRGYEGYNFRQLIKMAHIEAMGDGSFILFDYKNRDALFKNAKTVHLIQAGAAPMLTAADKYPSAEKV